MRRIARLVVLDLFVVELLLGLGRALFERAEESFHRVLRNVTELVCWQAEWRVGGRQSWQAGLAENEEQR